ncbi:MAG: tyrosine-type recombinase/integrase [Candidatus Tenebribacter davisii]|nr:tyrosine-type recombinase/integrase [Candidatus Tenebribacter davisii]
MASILRKRYLDLSVIESIKGDRVRNRLAANSRRDLMIVGNRFNGYLKDTGQRINIHSIGSFLDQQKQVLAASSWNVNRQRLKKLIKHQPEIRDNYHKRVFVDEIFSDFKPVRILRRNVEYLTHAEVLELILGSTLRLALIIEFLFKTGCRISELLGVRLMDVKDSEQVKIMLTGKGSKQREVYIDISLYNRIQKEFKGLYWLFENTQHHICDRSNLYKKIKSAGRRILGKEIHPHMLRHSTANFLLKECGKSAKYVSQYLGHSDSAITMEMYLSDSPREEIIDLFRIESQRNHKTG